MTDDEKADLLRGMRNLRGICLVVFALSFAACGGATETIDSASDDGNAQKRSIVVPEQTYEIGRLKRAEVVALIDSKSPGWIFQHVTVSPVMDKKERFVGFRLEQIPTNVSKAFQIERGDVITSINGTSIARPAYVFQIWNSLRVVSEIKISFTRNDKAQSSRIMIVD